MMEQPAFGSALSISRHLFPAEQDVGASDFQLGKPPRARNPAHSQRNDDGGFRTGRATAISTIRFLAWRR